MLIQSGKVELLKGLPWAAIELTTSESHSEEVVLRIANWSRGLSSPFQLLFPVASRLLEGITMLTPHLWGRTLDLHDLVAVKSVYGVTGVMVDGRKPIPIEDAFVQELIQKTRSAAESWSKETREGSFVRVLIGPYRMLCGKVTKTAKELADVKIALRSTTMTLQIPIAALQNLGDQPRDYFYQEN